MREIEREREEGEGIQCGKRGREVGVEAGIERGEKGGGRGGRSIMCNCAILSHWVQMHITLPLEALDVKR